MKTKKDKHYIPILDQPIEELKWNKMWDMWAEGEVDSPYEELITFKSPLSILILPPE